MVSILIQLILMIYGRPGDLDVLDIGEFFNFAKRYFHIEVWVIGVLKPQVHTSANTNKKEGRKMASMATHRSCINFGILGNFLVLDAYPGIATL